MFSLGLTEMILLLLMGTGLGLPLGLPPQPEDPVMARIAPAECLAYLSLAGVAPPAAQSNNSTERILAEPEVQRFVQEVKRLVEQAVVSHGPAAGQEPRGPRDVAWQLLELSLTQPAAAYVTDFDPTPQGLTMRAAMVIKTGDRTAQAEASLRELFQAAPGGQQTDVTVSGVRLHQFQGAGRAPPITFGSQNGYLIAAVGDGEAEQLLRRFSGEPPAWLSSLKRRMQVQRPSTTAYVNLAKILERIKTRAPSADMPAALDALGLSGLTVWGACSGLDGEGFTNRMYLGTNGTPTSLLAALDQPPLEKADLLSIPADAVAAYVARLNLLAVFDAWMAAVAKADPNAAAEMQQGLAAVEGRLGIRVRDDLLAAAGNTWKAFATQTPGAPLPTAVISLDIRDRQRFSAAFDKLIALAEQTLARRPGGPKFVSQNIAGRPAKVLQIPGGLLPVAPSFCLTDNQLVIAISSQALEQFLSKPPARSLTDVPEIATLLPAEAKPLVITYQDTPRIFQTVYPQLVGAIPMIAAAQGGRLPFDPALLPSVEALQKHLRSSTMVINRAPRGWDFQSRQSIPGLNLGPSAPVAIALLLPAVQAAREAARRAQGSNNLKQIGLALHNYHDVYRAFPASYSADGDGKPLLSWRVHILPFIEQQELYRQFRLDEPWDSEHNRKLIARMPAVYAAPGSQAALGKTVYLGVRGPNAVFSTPARQAAGKPSNLGRGIQQIMDGTSNTIMVVEVPEAKSAEWTKPDDLAPEQTNPVKGLAGLRPGGFQVLFCDGSVRFISVAVRQEVFQALLTIDGGELVNTNP